MAEDSSAGAKTLPRMEKARFRQRHTFQRMPVLPPSSRPVRLCHRFASRIVMNSSYAATPKSTKADIHQATFSMKRRLIVHDHH